MLSATSGHQGILSFTAEAVDVVVLDLNGDGAEGAVIAGELKRIRPDIPVVILTAEGQTLVDGALECADAVVPRLDHPGLLRALEATCRSSNADSE